jgi:uncharacterized protein (DUF1015 family)
MSDVRPFRAFRPRPDVVARVACPPYDVISTSEARALAEGNPWSFLHVTRPEIDLPEGTDEHAEEVYAAGAKNLQALIEEGVLRQDDDARMYVYAQAMPFEVNGVRATHEQVGVVACASVRDYDNDVIKKHEKTRADKEDDRTRHILTLEAHDEPVFLTYLADANIGEITARTMRGTPSVDFVSDEGTHHRLWVMSREDSLATAELFREVPALYVADGHHRSAAASRVAKERRGHGGEHDSFLAVLFPHDQMKIMAYNRVVRDPKGRNVDAIKSELERVVDLSRASSGVPSSAKRFHIYLGGKWYEARVRDGSFDAADPVASLDCSICQDQILSPIFNVQDPRRDKHIDFAERRSLSGASTRAR